MQIIPVIDLKNGQVVRAVKGIRSRYQPIQSRLCSSSEPVEVTAALLDITKSDVIYLADLDSIEGTANHLQVVSDLSRKFKNTLFWIDAGFKTHDQINLWKEIKNFRPVIGTESHSEIKTLLPLLNKNSILSLDFKNHQLSGPTEILTNTHSWPNEVIIMALDSVGSHSGPDMTLIDQIKKLSPNKKYYAAGGVRDSSDICLLEKNDLNGVLISTALHNTSLDQQK